MNTTFGIRLQAIQAHYHQDQDKHRYRRELSRLELDVSKAYKRCQKAGDDCSELSDLIEYLLNEMHI